MTSRFQSDDLRHFVAADGDIPPRIARTREHLADLCRFATVGPSGRPRPTPIHCRKRPNRKRCPGLLVVRLRDLPSQVEWSCPVCDAAGRIVGWEGTDADLRDLEPSATEATLRVAISLEDLRSLLPDARSHPELAAVAFGAELEGRDEAWVDLSPDHRPEVFAALLGHLTDEGASHAVETLLAIGASAPTAPTGRSARTWQLRVTLLHVAPPVWRRLLVPADISLPDLHDVLQQAMGWWDTHGHLFEVDDRVFSPDHDELERAEDPRRFRLAELAPREGSRFVYEYDLGDGWEHEIVVEAIRAEPSDVARCIDGSGGCPPEDCGGPRGYEELLEELSDPESVAYHDLIATLGDDFGPDAFDLAAADERVRAVWLRLPPEDAR